MAASSNFSDIFSWIQRLPPLSQWNTNSMSIPICSSISSSDHPSLNLLVSKYPNSSTISFSVIVDFNFPISLWTARPLEMNSESIYLSNEETISNLLVNFVEDALHYGSNVNTSCLKFLVLDSISNSKEIFNFAFLTLLFLVCIYEAPEEIRYECLETLKCNLENCESRKASKLLMKLLGSNVEELWTRSINLAITNWIAEIQTSCDTDLKMSSLLFSYSVSTLGLWKVHLYYPIIAMDVERSSDHVISDERLEFSLNYHQLEGVLQFNYKVMVREKWVDVMVDIDNVRCDIIRLVNENLISKRGLGSAEKHFPSRISLQFTPIIQTYIISVSVSKSSENPKREIGLEKTIEGSFEPQNPLGLKVSAGETITLSLKPWKFEQSVLGNSANLNWFLHDSVHGNEVASKKPSIFSLIKPKAWFRDRYSSAHRPFTRQGGVVFAGDEYGESVCWKIDKSEIGKSMEWEIKGWIWLTYWPNKYRTFYTETRRFEFRETLHLTVA